MDEFNGISEWLRSASDAWWGKVVLFFIILSFAGYLYKTFSRVGKFNKPLNFDRMAQEKREVLNSEMLQEIVVSIKFIVVTIQILSLALIVYLVI